MHRRNLLAGMPSLAAIAAAFFVRPFPAVAQNTPHQQEHGRAAVLASLAPTGTLRAAINYGNAVLARRDATGQLSGLSVDIARELGRRFAVPVALVPFDAVGKVTASAKDGVWDIAFLARDPHRAQALTFTEAYVAIHGSYVVRKTSPLTSLEQVDQPGIHISVSAGSAYDLFLSRNLHQAEIVRSPTPTQALSAFRERNLPVLAGIQDVLEKLLATDQSLRMISQPFMTIEQAMAVPTGRPIAAQYLEGFVQAIRADGFVDRHRTQQE